MKKQITNILWTGGWDSTYRIVQLSFLDIAIQPIYVIDPGRGSIDYELKSMNRIVLELQKRKGTHARFLPILAYNLSDIPKNDEVSIAYETIRESVKIGSQYEWLGWLALQYPGIEIGIEKPQGEFNGCVAAVEKYGKFKKEGDVMIVDQDFSSVEINMLFGNFTFPIVELTETEMLNNIKRWGYEDIMKLIWFCHTPIRNQPCGMCRPCQQKMECSMGWLLPTKSQRRYIIYNEIKKRFGEKIAINASKIIRKL